MLVITTSGPIYLVVYSFFTIVGERVTLAQRIKTIRRFLAAMYLLHKAGLVSKDVLEKERKIMTSFLMFWVGLNGTLDLVNIEQSTLDGSFNEARRIASGENFFRSSGTEGVVTTAKRLRIGCIESIFLRHVLGMSYYNALLVRMTFVLDQVTNRQSKLVEQSVRCVTGMQIDAQAGILRTGLFATSLLVIFVVKK